MNCSVLLAVCLLAGFARGQTPVGKTSQGPVEANVCRIFANPSSYNNKIVKVRGYVEVSSEYSVLLDEGCDGNPIWFAFADGSAPPQLRAFVNGKGVSGNVDAKGKRIPPRTVYLAKDANYEQFIRALALSAKGKACADGPPPELPPDCTTYRVTATFTGRVDGVSKQVHQAHLKWSGGTSPDGKGFGQMGLFDAEIVVQSIEDVVAVDQLQGSQVVF
jgi:hypothetical protein